MRRAIPILIMAAVPLQAAGECVTVEGDRILAADLARAHPAFSELPPGQPVGFSPAPGVERVLKALQLRLLWSPLGTEAPHLEDICVRRISELLGEERVLSALRAALPSEATVELVEYSRRPVPVGELDFSLAGLSSPGRVEPDRATLWRGTLRYGNHRSVSVWARVRVSVPRRQVVAVCDLSPGHTITAEDVEEQSANVFPRNDPGLDSRDRVVGRSVRRTIQAGEAIHASQLEVANDVERGQTVAVTVLSGATCLLFEARAETGGRVGDSVAVHNPVSGERFQARVTGRREVLVRVRDGSDST